MAQNLQQLRRRIKTAQNISKIAKAMEMIAASKIKKAQNAVESNKPYSEKIRNLTQNLLASKEAKTFKHPYIIKTEEQTSERKILIAVASDKGLCGSLNTNLIKKLFELEDPNTYLITLGRKVEIAASRTKFELLASFPMGTSLPSYADLHKITVLVNEYIEQNKAAKVEILYTGFESLFTQKPEVKTLLPIVSEYQELSDTDNAVIIEPSVASLLEKLLPHYFEVELYQSLIEAYTSEQAARMVSMQNAKNNASDIAEYLTLMYNKSRQEKITTKFLM
jgi:F-type H+-transporting ATPase subunit gamma